MSEFKVDHTMCENTYKERNDLRVALRDLVEACRGMRGYVTAQRQVEWKNAMDHAKELLEE